VDIGLPLVRAVDGCANSTYDIQGSPMPFPGEKSGLAIQAELDRGSYPTGIKVTDQQLAAVNMTPDAFHGEWNYSIRPVKRKK
jgi:hypothetical protein